MNQYLNPERFCDELPPIYTFHRPLWAYAELPDGINILRRSLFGNTRPFINELTSLGHTRLGDSQLRQIMRLYDIQAGIHPVLVCMNHDKTAVELAVAYHEWEEETFSIYHHRAQQAVRAELGRVS